MRRAPIVASSTISFHRAAGHLRGGRPWSSVSRRYVIDVEGVSRGLKGKGEKEGKRETVEREREALRVITFR